MEKKETKHLLLMEILHATLHGTENIDSIKARLTPEILTFIYHLAKKHDLAHVISHFVFCNQIETDAALQEMLQQEEILSVYRHERMQNAFEEICATFDKACLPYIPLKGAVLRPHYPYEGMRTSGDIDILINESDLDTATKLLVERGYQSGERHYHDAPFYSPGKIHLELHFNIRENHKKMDALLKDAWQYAAATQGCRYDFQKDFFVFYMFSHMAYHFLDGGCGLRSLLDIWVMEHKMEAPYFCAEKLLKKAGIFKFAAQMSVLANKCFTENDENIFSDVVFRYIYRGGVYGNSENKLAVYKSKKNSSFLYILERMFLPYRHMVTAFPILKKAPILLPFCWVARWVKALFGGKSKRIASEISCANRVPDQRIEEVKAIRAQLGL